MEIFPDESTSPVSVSGGVLCGPQTRYFVIPTSQEERVIGVHFRPGGASRFLRFPAGELEGHHVSMDTLWGNEARGVREQILEATTPVDKLRGLEEALFRIWRRDRTSHRAVRFALAEIAANPGVRLSEILDHIGFSRRHFIELFRQEVGLTPKVFQRLGRFQKVLTLIRPETLPDWSELALAAGYYDQAHFIAEFKQFSGLCPTAYDEQRTEHLNHVPLNHASE